MKQFTKSTFTLPLACTGLLFAAACSAPVSAPEPAPVIATIETVDIDPNKRALALREVAAKHARGARVWCVPFARDLSGIQIRGNANTWWGQAEGQYARGQEPRVGAVMAWKATKKNPMGHVAVVSRIVSDREIRVDHANWKRNKVAHEMAVIDVSDAGDWSAVKLESNPGAFGSVYPITGFIYPGQASAL